MTFNPFNSIQLGFVIYYNHHIQGQIATIIRPYRLQHFFVYRKFKILAYTGNIFSLFPDKGKLFAHNVN